VQLSRPNAVAPALPYPHPRHDRPGRVAGRAMDFAASSRRASTRIMILTLAILIAGGGLFAMRRFELYPPQPRFPFQCAVRANAHHPHHHRLLIARGDNVEIVALATESSPIRPRLHQNTPRMPPGQPQAGVSPWAGDFSPRTHGFRRLPSTPTISAMPKPAKAPERRRILFRHHRKRAGTLRVPHQAQ